MCILEQVREGVASPKGLWVFKAVMRSYPLSNRSEEEEITYHSLYEPRSREEGILNSKGEYFQYIPGKKNISRFENTLGMYCFERFGSADFYLDWVISGVVMKGFVPPGTKIKRGQMSRDKAFHVIVVEEFIPYGVVTKG